MQNFLDINAYVQRNCPNIAEHFKKFSLLTVEQNANLNNWRPALIQNVLSKLENSDKLENYRSLYETLRTWIKTQIRYILNEKSPYELHSEKFWVRAILKERPHVVIQSFSTGFADIGDNGKIYRIKKFDNLQSLLKEIPIQKTDFVDNSTEPVRYLTPANYAVAQKAVAKSIAVLTNKKSLFD